MSRNRQFILLIFGQTTANLADVLYIIALINLVYQTTGSAFYASIVVFVTTMAIFAAGILAPVLLQRIQMNRLLVHTQLLKTILLLLLWLFIVNTDQLPFFVLIGFVIVISFLDGFANPIKQSLIPHYVKEEELMKANSLAESIFQIMQVSSWMIGGVLLVWLSSDGVILFSFVLYCLATIAFFLLQNIEVSSQGQEKTSLFTQTTEGFSILVRHVLLRKLLLINALESVASAVWISSILLVYAVEVIGKDGAWWGFINAAFFAGLICISILMYRFDQFVEAKRKPIVLTGAAITALATFLFGFTTIGVIALISSFLVGVGTQLKGIPLLTLFQQTAPKEKLPLLYAAEGTVVTALFGIASLAFGIMADKWGVASVFFLSAGCLAGVWMLCAQLLLRIKESN
ncbi:MAG: MFS transporter [Lysinibacillus sp.]